MAGIRLRSSDPTWFNARVALTHPTRMLKPRYEPDGKRTGCFACGGMVHDRVTVHLDFDSDGNAFVSREVFKLLKEAGLEKFGLRIEAEVEQPPDQIVHMGGANIALTAFNKERGGKFPRLAVIKNRILRPSELAVPKE